MKVTLLMLMVPALLVIVGGKLPTPVVDFPMCRVVLAAMPTLVGKQLLVVKMHWMLE